MAVFFDVNSLPSFRQCVVTIGTFDGVHKGHQEILNAVKNAAAETGGESILITFEPHPRKLLYPEQSLRLLTPLNDKVELLTREGIDHIVVSPFTHEFAALSAEDYVSQFLVRYFNSKCIIIGYDHRFGHDRSGDIALLKNMQATYGYDVQELPAQLIDEAAVSSTKIRNALTAGDVHLAAQMLGRPYNLKGEVVAGAQIGRTIGYPTANIKPLFEDQLIPGIGIYAVFVEIDDIVYGSMLSIGYNPTVTDKKILVIEAYIFDFNQDIYGKVINLKFVDRLRNEEHFPSLDALKTQLGNDEIAARAALLASSM